MCHCTPHYYNKFLFHCHGSKAEKNFDMFKSFLNSIIAKKLANEITLIKCVRLCIHTYQYV